MIPEKKIVVFLNAEEVHSMPVLFHCHSAYCQDFIMPLLTDYSTIFIQIKVKQMQVRKQTVSSIKHDGTTPDNRCFNLSIIALTSFMVTRSRGTGTKKRVISDFLTVCNIAFRTGREAMRKGSS